MGRVVRRGPSVVAAAVSLMVAASMVTASPAASVEVAKAQPIPLGISVWTPVDSWGYTDSELNYLVFRRSPQGIAAATVAIQFSYQPDRASVRGVYCMPVTIDPPDVLLQDGSPDGSQVTFDGKRLLVSRLDANLWTSYKRAAVTAIVRYVKAHGGKASVGAISKGLRACWR